jgi:peptide-methionine (R)-S-oxide reductase
MPTVERLELSDAEWKKRLTPERYTVMRNHGTEPSFCGGYSATKGHGAGTYHCGACHLPLFISDAKFESGTGWPSFFQPIEGHVATSEDRSYLNMLRIEVHCARCGGHLGHVFDDGPRPTGQRFCINAIALEFKPARA